jgi:predicted nucleotidyltransferase component of viral defense system
MYAADNPFLPQARLAVRVLRVVAGEPALALKGGTAINLFFRDLPRLSVDLDLVYLPLQPREAALRGMTQALQRVAKAAEAQLPGVKLNASNASRGKLVAQEPGVQVKVEVNTVLRGSVLPAQVTPASPAAVALFNDLDARTLALEEVYAGKLVAALDRQHPRDLYDVLLLLNAEGLSPRMLDAFVVYLASHDRPMHEVLVPPEKDVAALYAAEFADMPAQPVALDALLDARRRMIQGLHRGLEARHRAFLLSVKRCEPDWALLPVPHLAELPGLRWKLLNLEKFRREQPERHAAALANLERTLDRIAG